MDYIVKQFNCYSDSNYSDYMTQVGSNSQINRYKWNSDYNLDTTSDNTTSYSVIQSSIDFRDEILIVGSGQSGLERGKSYFYHGKIKRLDTYQTFQIILTKEADTTSEADYQYIKNIGVAAGSGWADVQFIFTVQNGKDYENILFKLERSMDDYQYETRFPIILHYDLYRVENLFKDLIGEDKNGAIKIGVQSNPGLMMCVNQEEIHVGRTGLYELRNGIIYTTFFGVGVASNYNASSTMTAINKICDAWDYLFNNIYDGDVTGDKINVSFFSRFLNLIQVLKECESGTSFSGISYVQTTDQKISKTALIFDKFIQQLVADFGYLLKDEYRNFLYLNSPTDKVSEINAVLDKISLIDINKLNRLSESQIKIIKDDLSRLAIKEVYEEEDVAEAKMAERILQIERDKKRDDFVYKIEVVAAEGGGKRIKEDWFYGQKSADGEITEYPSFEEVIKSIPIGETGNTISFDVQSSEYIFGNLQKMALKKLRQEFFNRYNFSQNFIKNTKTVSMTPFTLDFMIKKQ